MNRPTQNSLGRGKIAALALLVTLGASASVLVGAPAAEARPAQECWSRTLRSWHTWVSPMFLGPLRYTLCRNDIGEID
jgi:hypothetical protein